MNAWFMNSICCCVISIRKKARRMCGPSLEESRGYSRGIEAVSD
jgi:hypothetical protein